MVTPHQGSGECSLLKIMILHVQETCSFLNEVLSTTQYEDISRAADLEKSMKIDYIFQQSHCQEGFNEAYPNGHPRGSVMNNRLSGCPPLIFHLPITPIIECMVSSP
ncbi:hypothetical protein MTR_2g045320 [Medicago truncatula]|uniref:Uncharacterized protein n=1 Tax=Medicago truncatula TaxID=3880 RepID=G7IQF9_MEDTR|nr:hypothetical protein MTR_2g045320 [Medicago truncatula]